MAPATRLFPAKEISSNLDPNHAWDASTPTKSITQYECELEGSAFVTCFAVKRFFKQ